MDVDDIVPVLILAVAIGVALWGLAWSKLKTLGGSQLADDARKD